MSASPSPSHAEIGTAIVKVIAATGFTKYPIARKAKLLHQTVHRLNLGSASCTSAVVYLQRKCRKRAYEAFLPRPLLFSLDGLPQL